MTRFLWVSSSEILLPCKPAKQCIGEEHSAEGFLDALDYADGNAKFALERLSANL